MSSWVVQLRLLLLDKFAFTHYQNLCKSSLVVTGVAGRLGVAVLFTVQCSVLLLDILAVITYTEISHQHSKFMKWSNSIYDVLSLVSPECVTLVDLKDFIF